MAGHRLERVNEQLKRELSRIVVGEVSDPRVGAVTVTRVSAAPDLTFARVFVQLMGDEPDRAETMEGLRAAIPYIRTLLADRMDMRRVPELRFERDRSLEHAMRIEELLSEAAMGEDRDPDDDPDEGGPSNDG
jgi:ribosome-binding factor A